MNENRTIRTSSAATMFAALGVSLLIVNLSADRPASAETLSIPAKTVIEAADGLDVGLTCQTSSLWLDATPFEASEGEVKLRLRFTGKDGESRTGVWFIDAVPDAHKRSFAFNTKQECKDGCVLRLVVAPDKVTGKNKRQQIELWAPNPAGIDSLKDDQKLTVVTFKFPAMELKASMFKGRTPLGFEQGTCDLTKGPAVKEIAPEPTDTPVKSKPDTPQPNGPDK